MSVKTEVQERVNGLIEGWRTFWFRPQAAYTLGIVRIAFGALMIGWTLLLASDLSLIFGTKGVMPKPPDRAFTWGVFHAFSSDSAILVGWIVLLVASFALMVGWQSRVAAIIVWVLILSFERRDPLIFNSGDTVIRIEALFLALAPCGAALSLDQRRRTGSFWSAQEFKPWALRLLQVQLTIIYLSTVVDKLAGETWQNGTAVGYSLRQPDLQIIPMPSFMLNSLLVSNVLTWGTLMTEVALGVLVWNQKWRPWILAVGVMLHVSISLTLEVGFFSCSMFILYLAFIPPERARTIAEATEERLKDLVLRLRHRDTAPDDAGASMTSAAVDDKGDEDAPVQKLKRQPAGPQLPAASMTHDVPSHLDPHTQKAAQISAALDAIKRRPEGDKVARAQRLATAPRNGLAGAAALDPEPADELTRRHGRHARHAMQ